MFANNTHRRALRVRSAAHQRGASLVELMVGLVIAMLIGITTIGSMQFFSASQGQAQTSNAAQGAATLAMAAIKRELSMAGLGLYHDGAPLCPGLQLSAGATDQTLPALQAVDTQYTGSLAQLTVAYGSALDGSTPALLASPANTGDAVVQLASHLPARVGDEVVLAPGPDSTEPCTLRTVTGVTAATELNPLGLAFAAAGARNQLVFGSTTALGDNSKVALLGEFTQTRFKVDANQNLLMERPLLGTSVVLAQRVVGFDVRYGVADTTNQQLQSWQAPVGSWSNMAADHQTRVRVVRVELVIRGDRKEKPDADGNCTATTEAPQLMGTALSLSGDWQCYRYRSASTTVALRNLLIGSQP